MTAIDRQENTAQDIHQKARQIAYINVATKFDTAERKEEFPEPLEAYVTDTGSLLLRERPGVFIASDTVMEVFR